MGAVRVRKSAQTALTRTESVTSINCRGAAAPLRTVTVAVRRGIGEVFTSGQGRCFFHSVGTHKPRFRTSSGVVQEERSRRSCTATGS